MLDPYDIGRYIENHKLPKAYYSYVIDAYIRRCRIEDALKCADAHNILITPEQLEEYKKTLQKKNA